MVNPLQLLAHHTRAQRHVATTLRRVEVEVPTQVAGTDAIFLVLRRMRTPLIIVVAIFAFCVAGLSLMPGTDSDGNPHHLSLFDAFYVMSYTATTIGFGEIPYSFSYAQRMWVTLSIYLTVTGWAYAISALFGLLQDSGFQTAIAAQRFRRKVCGIGEPFWIVAGYGDAGRMVAARLDALGRRFVVLDDDAQRIDKLAIDQLTTEVPALDGDVHNPSLLGMAGLDNPRCQGVIALTTDEANLAVVMAVNLLRPDVPVIARADDRQVMRRMRNFSPEAIINPYDRYGAYLSRSMESPKSFQLTQWLMAADGSEFRPRPEGLDDGTWLVLGDDRFGEEVAHDLRENGLEVVQLDPADGDPDVSEAVGLVAGSHNDVVNLALAAHARLENPDIFIAVRQRENRQASAMRAFDADSVFVPSELVAREVIARIMAPAFWDFIEHVFSTDDERWSGQVLHDLHERVGLLSPTARRVPVDHAQAPAIARWLARGRELTLHDVLRDPLDRERPLQVYCLSLIRAGESTHAPAEDTKIEAGDELVLVGTPEALRQLHGALDEDPTLEHLVTGEKVPATWLWRELTRHRRA
ncbi:hypothetical protein GCM10027418_14480 [Mariniluteicoccus endophyticus]